LHNNKVALGIYFARCGGTGMVINFELHDARGALGRETLAWQDILPREIICNGMKDIWTIHHGIVKNGKKEIL
jgi:hypothetical protein